MKRGDKSWDALIGLLDSLSKEPMLKTLYRDRMAFVKTKAIEQGFFSPEEKNKLMEALTQLFARSTNK